MDLERLLRLSANRQAMVATSIHPLRRKQLFDQAFTRTVAERRNDAREVAGLATVSVRLAESAGEELLAARARLELANALRRLDRCRDAWSLLGGAEPVIRRHASEVDFAQLVCFRASIALQSGNDKEVLADLATVRQRRPSALTAALWAKLGSAHRYGGQLDRAQNAYWRALQLADELDLPIICSAAAHDMAAVFLEAGRPEVAHELLDRLAPLSELVGSRSDQLQTGWLRGRILAASGLDEQAAVCLEAVALQTMFGEVSGGVSMQAALDALSVTQRNRGDVAGLLDRFTEALARTRRFDRFVRALQRARRCSGSKRAGVISRLRVLPVPADADGWLDPVAARRRHADVSSGAERFVSLG